MVEIYNENPMLLIIAAAATLLFMVGSWLIMKTTGKRYIGLAAVGISVVVFFYLFAVVIAPTMPGILVVRRIVTGVLLIGVVYFVVLECYILKDAKLTVALPVDYLIVHGAKVLGSTPSPSLQDRLDGTLEYLNKFPCSKAVLTGTKWPWGDMSEARCMQEWLMERGISESRLILEEKAKNTVDNLRYSMESIEILETERVPVIGVLTSEYHMHRTLYLAKHAGIKVVGIPVQTARSVIRINYFIREAFAMTEIFVFGVKHK